MHCNCMHFSNFSNICSIVKAKIPYVPHSLILVNLLAMLLSQSLSVNEHKRSMHTDRTRKRMRNRYHPHQAETYFSMKHNYQVKSLSLLLGVTV